MSNIDVEPRLEAKPGRSEAGAGWLIWLSLSALFVFCLVLISGEIDRRVGLFGAMLSAGLFLYERRRVHSVGKWSSGLGTGCAGGVVLATAVGQAVDKTGLMEVWDGRDQMTLRGMLLVWGVMIVGMALAARWSAGKTTPKEPRQATTHNTAL